MKDSNRKAVSRRMFIAGAVTTALALMLAVVTISTPERVRLTGFCAPAAHIAALITGAPCTVEADCYRLRGPAFDLAVVPACAAADFCSLLAGFLSLLMFWRRWPLVSQLAVLPLAWIITVTANAVRLVSCWHADRWACVVLPPALGPGIHLMTGIATFLLVLTAVFWGMTRWRMTDELTKSRRTP